MPTISEPNNLKYAQQLAEVMDADEYEEFVQQVKREYARQVGDLIQTNRYKRMSDEEKAEEINKIRQKLYSDKQTNEFLKKYKSLPR